MLAGRLLDGSLSQGPFLGPNHTTVAVERILNTMYAPGGGSSMPKAPRMNPGSQVMLASDAGRLRKAS